MISKKMNDVLNEQVVHELYSSNLYLSMYAWFSDKDLLGFANWLKVQAAEEYQHFMKIFDYILERGGTVKLGEIKQPPHTWKSAQEVCQAIVDHEAGVTAGINKLMDIALDEKDHASSTFLQWFVTEQVEEESSVGEVLARVKMVGDKSSGLFHLDMELGKRTLQPIDQGA